MEPNRGRSDENVAPNISTCPICNSCCTPPASIPVSRNGAVDDPPSDTADDDASRILMEWSLWDERADEHTGRRIRVVPNDGPEGAWKAILEAQPYAALWVEKATIGYGDFLDDFEIVEPETTT